MDQRVAEVLGTFEVAKLCHVTPATVSRWIRAGKLAHFVTPGGHRRVFRKDVLVLLQTMGLALPAELRGRPATSVLVVDDNPVLRRAVSRTFQSEADLSVCEASGGFEAGEIVARLNPRIVLLDLHMPGLDGFAVCRLLCSRAEGFRPRILAMSAYDPELAQERALACGADDFLAKPFDIAELLVRVRRLLK